MTVNDVAKMVGVSPMTIRVGLQQGVFPFGVALKTSDNRKNYTYVLFPEKVREYIGDVKEGGNG